MPEKLFPGKCELCGKNGFLVDYYLVSNDRYIESTFSQCNFEENHMIICMNCKIKIDKDQKFFNRTLDRIIKKYGYDALYKLSDCAQKIGKNNIWIKLFRYQCNYRKKEIEKKSARKRVLVNNKLP